MVQKLKVWIAKHFGTAYMDRVSKDVVCFKREFARTSVVIETIRLIHPGDLNTIARDIRADNEKWWTDPATGKPLNRNKGEMLMLMVSEIAEAMEGERKSQMDDHLPHRPMAEVELADLYIRLMDYCGGWGYDIGGAVAEKRAYNKVRQDHTNAARLAPGGKKF